MENKLIPVIDKEDYFKDTQFISFSTLKVFSKCETLFRDTFITKVYEEPDHEYFIYGKLVDALVTESKKYVEDNFILVERKKNIEDTLSIENKIKDLKNEMSALEEKVAKGNKVAIKGYASRTEKIKECEEQLAAIKLLGSKIQITPALWRECEETAQAIKSHPYFASLEFNELTSQQVFTCEINGTKRKGKLDHLKLSPAISQVYGLYKVGMIDYEELRKQIALLHPQDLWAIITDIKTFYSMEKLEPWHYRGQLKMYQQLVSVVLGIPHENITCQILGADKQNGKIKKSEFFRFTQKALDEISPDIEYWVAKWQEAMQTGVFVSDKSKNGIKQTCYTCTECRFCPLSTKPGEPVIIDAPRFSETVSLDMSEILVE